MVDVSGQGHLGFDRSGGRSGRQDRSVLLALEGRESERIHNANLEILETIGLAGVTFEIIELACEKGCQVSDAGRLCFPRALVEDLIAMQPMKPPGQFFPSIILITLMKRPMPGSLNTFRFCFPPTQ